MLQNDGKGNLGNTPEHLRAKVGNSMIWEIQQVKLSGVTIDENVNFNEHLSIICKEENSEATALAKMVEIIPLESLLKIFSVSPSPIMISTIMNNVDCCLENSRFYFFHLRYYIWFFIK